MNRFRSSWLAVGVFVVGIFVVSGCGNDDGVPKKSDLTAWEYEQAIPEELHATVGSEDVTLGDVATNAATIVIPAGAFDDTTDVTLKTPEEVPGFVPEDMAMIGAPIEIDSSGEKRLNEPMVVTFPVEQSVLDDAEATAALRMVYHDGTRWATIKPVEIDQEKKVAIFHMYHFSYAGLTQAKADLVKKQWIESQSLDNYISSSTDDISGALAEKAIDLTLAKMGITDDTVKGAILSDIIKDGAYAKMFDSYQKGDVAAFNEEFSVLMGKKIAERVPSSMLSGALSKLTDSVDDVKVVSQAAGYAAEGQYKEAAKMVGEMIADKFLITTAGKIATEVIQGQINGWRDEEISAAYDAYKNGANGRFWGYNVDPGDFDAVWRQMRGIGRQIELEAIATENAIRTDAGMPELTEKEIEKVRLKTKEAMRKQFENRADGDDKIAYEKEQLEILMNAFDERGFFDTYGGPQGFQKGHTLETKMDILDHFAKKMMKDVGLYELVGTKGKVEQERIRAEAIVLGAQNWFSEPDGKKKYREYLHENFGVPLYPKLSDLSGAWSNSVMTVTDIEISDEARAEMEAMLEGCEVEGEGMALEDLVGREMPMPLTIQPSSDSGGTLTVQGNDGPKSVPFTYKDGAIHATVGDDDAVSTLSMPVVASGDGFAIDGTVNTEAMDGALQIKMDITASK